MAEMTIRLQKCRLTSNRMDIPTEMTIDDVNDVFTILQNNSAEYITNIVEAEDRFGTSPIGDAYGCMLTTRMIPVLYNMTGFTKKFQYPNIKQTLSTEIGGANNVRFFVSEQGSVSPNASLLGNDIANCFVSAKEAYKVVRVRPDHYKSFLIDLETYGESYGDKAQATYECAA
jgi:N4-gp56 family major capsid protein